MNHLIEYEDYQIKIAPELLLIKPFRVLFNSDKTKDKNQFMSYMSIVFFGYDPRSTYSYITNEEERLRTIYEQEGLPKTFKIPDKVKECIEIYKKHVITKSFLLLESSMIAIDKVSNFLREFELQGLDEKDRFNALKSLTSTIQMIPKLSADLLEAQNKVTKELEEKGRARGNQGTKTLMDD